MSNLFRNCAMFNENLNEWNVKNVTNMFIYCINFNSPLDKWNVSNITNMESMLS